MTYFLGTLTVTGSFPLQFPAGLRRKLALVQSRATCSSLLPQCALCRVVSVLIVGRDLERCSKEVLGRGVNIVPNSWAQVPTILAGSTGAAGAAVLQHGQALTLCCHRTRDYLTSIGGWWQAIEIAMDQHGMR